MIVVDTSVWIDYFNGTLSPETNLLDEKLDNDLILMGDLILLEILQGFQSDKEYKVVKQHLLQLKQGAFLDHEIALKAADNYRSLRKKGITIRKTNDVIIASYCIEHQLSLLFSGRDFHPFVQHLTLLSAMD